jgi:signal transduction histidine kinase/ligand-binding sensor domain-containing protein/CheY-like chemotaxis protein
MSLLTNQFAKQAVTYIPMRIHGIQMSVILKAKGMMAGFCKSAWCLFFLLLVFNDAFSQEQNYSLQQVSLEQGLSQSTIQCLHRDHWGRLWLGTKNGLNCYDGVSMRTYFHGTDQPNGLPDNNINFITQDKNQTFWISTEKGLVKYEEDRDIFEPVYQQEPDDPGLYSSFLMKGDSMLFGATDHICVYDASTKELSKLFFKGVRNISLKYKMLEWNDGLLIASRWEGLLYLDLQTGELSQVPFFDENAIVTVLKDQQDNLWISVYKKGLFVVSPSGEMIKEYTTSNSALKNDNVLSIREIKKGEIWIGTDGGGVQAIHPGESTIDDLPIRLTEYPELNSVSVLYSDEFSNVWLGTINGGAFCLKEVIATSYSNVSWNNPGGLSSQTVLSIFMEDKDQAWIGTDGGGINKYSLKEGTFMHYPDTRTKKVNAITQLSDQELLINCFGEGMKVFNKRTGRLSDFPLKVLGEGHQLPGGGHFGVGLLTISATEVLVMDNFLHVIDLSSRTVSLVPDDQLLPNDGELKKTGKTQNEVYLHGSHGIYKFDLKKRELVLVHKTPGDANIRAAYIDDEQSVWVSTTNSFYRVFNDLAEEHPLDLGLTGAITSIAGGTADKLWLGAGRSLLMLDKKTGEIHRVGNSEGIMPNEFYSKATGNVDGQVLMGGATGLVHIRKELNRTVNVPIELFVNNLRIKDKLIDEKSISEFRKDSTINLPYNYGLLQFNLVVKEKDFFKERAIRYRLDGFSDQFVETNDQRISVIGIGHGEYRVQIKVIGDDGLWTSARTVMKLNVRPPWWLTWWFKIVGLLVFLSLSFIVWYIMYNRHVIKMQMETQRREKKLNDQKITFMTNISHEIRTPLSLIFGPLELLLKENKDRIQRFGLLELVYKQANYLNFLVEQVLDLERMDEVIEQLEFRKVNFKQWLHEILDSLMFELQKHDIQVEVSLDDSLTDVVIAKKALTKVIYNIVINVTKYASGTKILKVSAQRMDNDFFRISFTDEGQGIPENVREKIFDRFYQKQADQEGYGIGLAYAKLLIEKHGGKIAVKNVEPHGAQFYFDLPLNRKAESVRDVYNSDYSSDIVNETKDDNQKKELLGELTLLIVEDNLELLNYARQLFKQYFRKVIVAHNGKEGLEKASAELPDIILSDVMMPVMDGHEFCRNVKSDAEISHIPVVLLTARKDESSVKQGYKMGADAYLTKPFSNETLIDALYNILSGRLKMKESYMESMFKETTVAKVTTSNADENFMLKINRIIKEEISNPDLNVDFLVDKLAISRASLYSKFKSIVGVGINTYINGYRLSEARLLLEQTDDSMVEIAEKVGFQTQSYFSTVFKDQFGLSPMKYRQNSKK